MVELSVVMSPETRVLIVKIEPMTLKFLTSEAGGAIVVKELDDRSQSHKQSGRARDSNIKEK